MERATCVPARRRGRTRRAARFDRGADRALGGAAPERRVPPHGRAGGTHRAPADPLGAPDVARPPTGTARVLLVEDEPSMRFLCRVNLELGGYAVVEAETGAEALEQAQTTDVDLVLLDVMLPDIGGHEVARRLGAADGPAVAFLSARASRDDMREAFALGAVDYITKPFDPLALAARVREILDRVERGESEQFRLERLAELEG
jgi:CheY-like chemotaxis protein